MDIHEQLALRLAQERMRDAMCAAELRRAIRSAREGRPARIRLGRALVRLGRWMMGQPSPAAS